MNHLCASLVVLVAVRIIGVQTLVIPDEIPSVLSVIYSNIPTVKKGTDSRLGWGFRLGNRAHFQVMVELGPQTETEPLANQPDKEMTSRKRSAQLNPENTFYAQIQRKEQEQQQQRQQQQQQERKQQYLQRKQMPLTEGGRWLEKWRDSFKYIEGNGDLSFALPRPSGEMPGEVGGRSVLEKREDQFDLTETLKEIQEAANASVDTYVFAEPFLRFMNLMQKVRDVIEREKREKEMEPEITSTTSVSIEATTASTKTTSTTVAPNKVSFSTESTTLGPKTSFKSSTIVNKDIKTKTFKTEKIIDVKNNSSVIKDLKDKENLTKTYLVVEKGSAEDKVVPLREKTSGKRNEVTLKTSSRVKLRTTTENPKNTKKIEVLTNPKSYQLGNTYSNNKSGSPKPFEGFVEFLLRNLGFSDYPRDTNERVRKTATQTSVRKVATTVNNLATPALKTTTLTESSSETSMTPTLHAEQTTKQQTDYEESSSVSKIVVKPSESSSIRLEPEPRSEQFTKQELYFAESSPLITVIKPTEDSSGKFKPELQSEQFYNYEPVSVQGATVFKVIQIPEYSSEKSLAPEVQTETLKSHQVEPVQVPPAFKVIQIPEYPSVNNIKPEVQSETFEKSLAPEIRTETLKSHQVEPVQVPPAFRIIQIPEYPSVNNIKPEVQSETFKNQEVESEQGPPVLKVEKVPGHSNEKHLKLDAQGEQLQNNSVEKAPILQTVDFPNNENTPIVRIVTVPESQSEEYLDGEESKKQGIQYISKMHSAEEYNWDFRNN